MGWTAQGIETIKINEAQKDFGLKRIGQLIEEYEVSKIVIGFPKNMNGTDWSEWRSSQAFAKRLEDKFKCQLTLG